MEDSIDGGALGGFECGDKLVGELAVEIGKALGRLTEDGFAPATIGEREEMARVETDGLIEIGDCCLALAGGGELASLGEGGLVGSGAVGLGGGWSGLLLLLRLRCWIADASGGDEGLGAIRARQAAAVGCDEHRVDEAGGPLHGDDCFFGGPCMSRCRWRRIAG